MNTSPNPNIEQMLRSAERAIAATLAELEKHTGQHVTSIRVDDTDVTTMKDDRQQIARTVVIELRPAPGSKWVTAC